MTFAFSTLRFDRNCCKNKIVVDLYASKCQNEIFCCDGFTYATIHFTALPV